MLQWTSKHLKKKLMVNIAAIIEQLKSCPSKDKRKHHIRDIFNELYTDDNVKK